ncbi:protein FAM3B isoform X2 [Taeniopygia guttata]|uniref:protein FAM3B isoform X2 n=1 Tax=Taeniopygia guttata TaxID=59729 RepID=UPI003BB88124
MCAVCSVRRPADSNSKLLSRGGAALTGGRSLPAACPGLARGHRQRNEKKRRRRKKKNNEAEPALSAVLHVLLRLHPDCPSSWLLSATSSAWHFALRLFGLVLASVAAWYLGYFVAAYVPQNTVSIAALQEIGKKPVLRAPAPKRQKCDLWSPCPPGNFAYRILSGGGKQRRPTICFEDEELINAGNHVAGSGINIAIVNYKTGKFMSANFFEMWAGDHSREMMDFIRKAPEGTLLLMATHDDGSTRLNDDTKKLVEELGSKEIKNIKFRSSWVFIAAKGFKLPDNIQKEKINHSDQTKNRYKGWPAEIQIEGCIPRNLI